MQTESLPDSVINGGDSLNNSRHTEAQSNVQRDMMLRHISDIQHLETVAKTDAQSVEMIASETERFSVTATDADDADDDADNDDDDNNHVDNHSDGDEQMSCSGYPVLAAESWPSRTAESGVLAYCSDNDVLVCFTGDDDDDSSCCCYLKDGLQWVTSLFDLAYC